jgi:putative transposase
MPDYRRLFVPGGTYFFTVALAGRGSDLLVAKIDTFRDVYGGAHGEHGFRTDALVILPDHLHAVWTMPQGQSDFPLIWNKIKGRFSRRLQQTGPRSASKIAKRERGIWQRRYWEHLIRDERDFCAHVEYCWINPVKHGLVARVRDWPHSSFHRDVRRSIAPVEWAGEFPEGTYGEPVLA